MNHSIQGIENNLNGKYLVSEETLKLLLADFKLNNYKVKKIKELNDLEILNLIDDKGILLDVIRSCNFFESETIENIKILLSIGFYVSYYNITGLIRFVNLYGPKNELIKLILNQISFESIFELREIPIDEIKKRLEKENYKIKISHQNFKIMISLAGINKEIIENIIKNADLDTLMEYCVNHLEYDECIKEIKIRMNSQN